MKDCIWGERPTCLLAEDEVEDSFIEEIEPKQEWREEHPQIIPMIILGLLCIIALVTLPAISCLSISWRSFFEKLAEAGLIAAILGATVDWWLKRQITGDVFKASIGYLLPKPLKGEMRWIYDLPLVATHHQTVTIKESGINGYVIVTTTINKVIKNLSNKPHEVYPRIWVDEWDIKNVPTKIKKLGYEYKGKRIDSDEVTPRTDAPEGVKELGASKIYWYEKILLHPREKISIWSTCEETRAINDDAVYEFGTAIINPKIEVFAPDNYVTNVLFGHREECKNLSDNFFSLPATLLPKQFIRIRWYPKDRKDDASKAS